MIRGRFTTHKWKPTSMFIRWATDSDWSHIEVAIENYPGQSDGWLGSQAGKFGAIPAGVQIRPWNYDPDCMSQEFRIACSGVIEQAFYKSFVGKIGCPYDWSAVFGDVFTRDWHKKDSWFCSEAVEDSLEEAGDGLFREGNYWRITPGMFYLSDGVTLI